MSEWRPASLDEVAQAIEDEREQSDPAVWASVSSILIDPFPSTIERFGTPERAFVVARSGTRLVFYDDVEGDFGTADEAGGLLVRRATYGPLILALREAMLEGA